MGYKMGKNLGNKESLMMHPFGYARTLQGRAELWDGWSSPEIPRIEDIP